MSGGLYSHNKGSSLIVCPIVLQCIDTYGSDGVDVGVLESNSEVSITIKPGREMLGLGC